jgi:uncharacterized protein (DUF1330 family)
MVVKRMGKRIRLSRTTRIFLAFAICFLMPVRPESAAAEPLYFVSLAKIKPNAHQDYERFLTGVAPIWRRHNMEVLLRIEVDSKNMIEEKAFVLDEVAVLKVRSQKDFFAYINDPDYQNIKANRINAVDFFAVMEGNEANLERLEQLKSAALTQVVFSKQHQRDPVDGIRIKINLAGQVKGNITNFLRSVRSIAMTKEPLDINGEDLLHVVNGRVVR